MTKRVIAAILLSVCLISDLQIWNVMAEEEGALPIAQESMSDTVNEEDSAVKGSETAQIDTDLYTGDDPVAEESTFDAGLPIADVLFEANEDAFADESAQEQTQEDYAQSAEETEDDDPEVELEGWFDYHCGVHYLTKVDNVSCFNKPEKGRQKIETIRYRETLIKIVASKDIWVGDVLSLNFWDTYYKTDAGYWVLGDNIKKHSCTGGVQQTLSSISQRSGDNTNHEVIEIVGPKRCTTCSCIMENGTKTTKKEKHRNWRGNGYCGVCGYKFQIREKNMSKADYMVTADFYLRTEPYTSASTSTLLKKGTVLTFNTQAKNAYGDTWYKTGAGKWIQSNYVQKHSHSYSSFTGLCSCGKIYDYETEFFSNTAYQANGESVSAYQNPYKGSSIKKTYTKDVVFYVNGSSFSDPNKGFFVWQKGDKWFRTVDGYWVLSSGVQEHTKHAYSTVSAGKCTYTGCNAEFSLDVDYIHLFTHGADAYETVGVNIVARVKPYFNATSKYTYAHKYQIVMVNRYVNKNANGEKWYQTTDGYWIKATDIQKHAHRVSAGMCTSYDCGYEVNMGLKSMSPKEYETIVGQVPVKNKPFDDADNNRIFGKSKCVKVNGYTTKLDEKWFRTTDNKYVKARYLKEHTHSYSDGYCAVCGQYAAYTTQSIEPRIVETVKAGVTVFEKPYGKSKVKKTISGKGSKIIVTEQAINYYKDIWYSVSTGGWIQSANIKTPSGEGIKSSGKAKIENYIINVTDNKNNPITSAYVVWLGETYPANADGSIELLYVTDKTDLTINAPNYDTVTKTDYQMNKNRRDSVVLAVAGSFEATNVNMIYVGEKTDLLKKARSINHYHTQGFFNTEYITIECVMGSTVGVGKYKLVQGSKTVAESTTGKFEKLKTTSFAAKKSVDLQVFDTSGTLRATQRLLLNVFNVTEDNISNGIAFGLTKLSFSVGDGTPLLGGVEISFDPKQTLEGYIDVGDESTKVALDFTPKKDENGKFKYTSTYKAYKEFWKDLKDWTNTNGWTHFWRKYQEEKANLGKWKGGVKIGGYVEKMHGENVYKGKIYIEFSIKMEHFHQTLVGPVPVVLEIEVEGKATPYGTLTLTNLNKISDLKLGLDLAASVEAAAGVGIKYVASISVYGKATLKIEGDLLPKLALNDVYMYGTLGVKAKVLDMEIANLHIFDTPTLYIVQNGHWVLWEDKALLSDIITDENNYVPIERWYLQNRSEWYPGNSIDLLEDPATDEEISIVVSDFDFNVLQSSTYTDIRPQVVTADGVIMMVYNDDNAARDNIDKSMLVYSIYDTNAKEWSAPVPVYDDTTADYGFSVCNSNDEIYIVWQNAKSLQTASASLTELSKNTDLMVAKYEAAMGSFRYIEQVTDNEKYELMPRIASVNGKTVVSWYTNSDDDVFAVTGDNTIEYAYKLDADYAPKHEYVIDDSGINDDPIDEEVLPADNDEPVEEEEVLPVYWTYGTVETVSMPITSLAVGYMLDESYIAYTTDEDGNTATVDDQKIRLYDTQTDELCEYTDKASNVEFTDVHGDPAMTWYNQGMIYYAIDAESAPQQLYTEEVNLGEEYHIISDENGNMAILFTVKKEEASDAYVMLYDDDNYEWGLPIAITNQEKYIQNFNGAYADGMIVSIFNQTEVTDEEMDETNNLCSAIIGERHDVSISNVLFTDIDLEAGVPKPISVDVKNNGTVRISDFNITVYNGDELVAQETVEKVLKTGESANVELEITMPENLEKTTYVIEIDESGYDDAYLADNSQELIIGRAALVVTAEHSPTDMENIVIVTIENSGYEPSSGMIALFDDKNQVKEVLVENFEPIGHNESYTCAIKLIDAYFEGAAGKTFNIGVVPFEEQDIDAHNITTVYADNIHHDNLPDIEISSINVVGTIENDGISLMEETSRSITGKVKNETENDIENARVCVMTYDYRGVYLDMICLDTVSLDAGEESEFTVEFESMENVSIINVMLINNDSFIPLSSVVRIGLYDDLTNDEGIDESQEYDSVVDYAE